MIEWISESEELPPIAQNVLVIHPRQFEEFWDLRVMCLLMGHYGASPSPIIAGRNRWPTNYYWGGASNNRDFLAVTGNAYWSYFDQIPLPPGAHHERIRDFRLITQPSPVWIGQPARPER